MPVGSPGRLVYDHRLIIDSAVEHIRSRYEAEPDPDRLLGKPSPSSSCAKLHEAVAGEPLDRDMFRREMGTNWSGPGRCPGNPGRLAELFRRRRRGEPHSTGR